MVINYGDRQMSNTNQNTSIPTLEDLMEKYSTMSARIRKLDSMGMSRYAISKHLGIKYQWVRNVLITPTKKAKESIE